MKNAIQNVRRLRKDEAAFHREWERKQKERKQRKAEDSSRLLTTLTILTPLLTTFGWRGAANLMNPICLLGCTQNSARGG